MTFTAPPGHPGGQGVFSTAAEPGRPGVAGRPGRRPHADRGPLGPAARRGGLVRQRKWPAGVGRLARHGARGTRLAAADGRWRGHLGHRERAGLGDTGRDRRAARTRCSGREPDALPLRPGGQRDSGQRRRRPGPGRAAARRAARRAVVADRQAARHPVDRAVGALHRRVRPDRDRDGGADRGQRGQRCRGRRAPAGSACSSPSASRPPRWWRPTCSRSRPRRRPAPWPGSWPATCCPYRCSARPRGSTGWARWRCRPGSTWPCRWPCSA